MNQSNPIHKALQLFILVILHSTGHAQEIRLMDFKNHFDKYGVEGCFVLYDKSGDFYICYNPARCDSGYLPASTFKIPNSVIALEEKVISDTSQIFQWDGTVWPIESWNHDQTLKSAMKFSCVWVFMLIAEKVGIDKYCQYMNAFNYGNRNLAGLPDRFWLEGELRISAFQQVEFLRRFYDHKLNVPAHSIDMVKDIIVLENTGKYRLSGKTGSTEISGNDHIMWLVGYVELDKDVYFYAMNFTTDDYDGTRHARYEITKNILKSIKLIE
jgi:beta-lactamase class D